MSPATATAGREKPEQRAIGAHPADMNREKRRDKREDPAAIDRGARLFAGFDLRRHRNDARAVGQAQLGDDCFLGVSDGVNG